MVEDVLSKGWMTASPIVTRISDVSITNTPGVIEVLVPLNGVPPEGWMRYLQSTDDLELVTDADENPDKLRALVSKGADVETLLGQINALLASATHQWNDDIRRRNETEAALRRQMGEFKRSN
jgi:hypothetical protein